MKNFKIIILTLMMLIVVSTSIIAADFDWIREFNIQAQAEPSGFRARLATRFQIGEARISAVLSNLSEPGNAYMVFRLGEISHRPPEDVLNVYNANKGKGWGIIARKLAIKPGSQEFQALKKGHDLGGKDNEKNKAAKSRNKNIAKEPDRDGGNINKHRGKGQGKK